MKLIDGIKLKGKAVEIPDCSRDDLPQFFIDMGYKTGAEIGVAKGEFSLKLCQAGLTVYSIDPWLCNKDYPDSRGQKKMDYVYEHAKKILAPYPNSTIIKKTSMEASDDFADGSLDFVYIDGNHEFKFIAEDISEWSKKVKKGGIISGHDYMYTRPTNPLGICHVIPVLNAYTTAYNINDWYILGRKNASQGETRDRWRSWMFFKK